MLDNTPDAAEADRAIDAGGLRGAMALPILALPESLDARPGYDVAVRYFATGGVSGIGGDWYDTFRTGPDGPLVVTVGDIGGRGPETTSLVADLRASLRAHAFQGRSPTTCLTLLSQLLTADSDGALHQPSACMVLLDVATGMCRLANAGHPPPAVRAPDGAVEFIPGVVDPSRPAGSGLAVAEDFVALAPGAALVLYTGGLVVTPTRDIEAGLAALADVLAEPVTSADGLSDRLVDALMADRLDDDGVAVVVLVRA